jgi:hypothetical protein
VWSLTEISRFRKQITVLVEYTGSYQSAMTWGESEVSKIVFDCKESLMKYSSITWYEETQAQGRVTHEYSYLPWRPIDASVVGLFAEVCDNFGVIF